MAPTPGFEFGPKISGKRVLSTLLLFAPLTQYMAITFTCLVGELHIAYRQGTLAVH